MYVNIHDILMFVKGFLVVIIMLGSNVTSRMGCVVWNSWYYCIFFICSEEGGYL